MSAPLTLELSRHELFSLPPDTPAVGEAFRVEVTSDKRPAFWALARMVFSRGRSHRLIEDGRIRDTYWVFFRDEERPYDEIFAGYTVKLVSGETPTPEELLKQITKGANAPILTRFWQAPDFHFGLSLRTDGQGSILDNAGRKDWLRDFYWGNEEDGEQIWAWNTREFQEFCRQMVVDPTSQFNFILRWDRSTPDEKTAISTRCEISDWNNLLRLFTWALQLVTHYFGPYWDENRSNSWWDCTYLVPRHYDCPAVFFARRWQEVLFAIVRPAFWPKEQPCQRRWRRSDDAGVEDSVTCEVPTMHEVLEARFRLREFLRPHLSAEEIEALLVP